jgi:hypothetical protein
MAAKDKHAKIEELLEAVFTVRSVPGLYEEQQLRLRESCDGSKKSRKLVWDGRQPGS